MGLGPLVLRVGGWKALLLVLAFGGIMAWLYGHALIAELKSAKEAAVEQSEKWRDFFEGLGGKHRPASGAPDTPDRSRRNIDPAEKRLEEHRAAKEKAAFEAERARIAADGERLRNLHIAAATMAAEERRAIAAESARIAARVKALEERRFAKVARAAAERREIDLERARIAAKGTRLERPLPGAQQGRVADSIVADQPQGSRLSARRFFRADSLKLWDWWSGQRLVLPVHAGPGTEYPQIDRITAPYAEELEATDTTKVIYDTAARRNALWREVIVWPRGTTGWVCSYYLVRVR